MRYLAAVVTAILISAACPAAAQQGLDPTAMSLEDLMAASVDHVYGASKFLQKVTDAPAAITIVTADDIRRYGYRTLADVLRSVEGISVSYDRNYSERHTHTGEVLDPALIANLNVVWPNFLRGLELKATAVNLLDGRYSEPVSENHRQGAIAEDGRQLFVGLTWRAK